MRRSQILALAASLLGSSIVDGKPNETFKLTAPERVSDNFISGFHPSPKFYGTHVATRMPHIIKGKTRSKRAFGK